MKKKLVLIVLFALSLMVIGCNDNNEPNKVIGIVNGTEITQAQFDHYYAILKTGYESQMGKKLDEKQDNEFIENLKERAFEDLVLQTAVQQDAEKKNIKISDKQVEEDLKAFKDRFGEKEYGTFLEQMGMTEADLKEQIELEKTFVVLKDELTANVKVSDEEINKFYNDNVELFSEPAGMEISHILVATEKEANEILTKLNQGEDFSKLALDFSTCPSKDQGGNLGLVNEESNLVEEFKTAALKLKSGEITKNPVKTEFGFHIIKAGEYKEAKTFSLEEVKDQIAAQLEVNNKNEVFNKYLQELKDNAKIEDKRK